MTEIEGVDIARNRFLKSNPYPLADDFMKILADVRGHTMVDSKKLRVLHELAIKTRELPGQIAEAGVWKGGIVYLLAKTIKTKTIHGFDSWEGLPEPDETKDVGEIMNEGWGKCQCPTEYLTEFGKRVVLHKGWFKDTLQEVSDEKFCLIHCDGDHYGSVKICLEFFVPRIVPGGFMVIDDYGFHLTPGATLAVDEYLKACDRPYKYWNWANAIIRFD